MPAPIVVGGLQQPTPRQGVALVSRGQQRRRLVDDELVNLNARVPQNLLRQVRTLCARSEVTMRDFITQALEQHLAMRQRRS